ncbi:GlxA family transcriptional regulator [Methylobacterium sp. NEAU 140]|uniref:GlxA family transcriptional regulator n=1 Tax=Methylobacterium sp. NEAU 140 TaxID=3064945 RepID=UPI002732AAEB|nr:GlxA family transcriptional regulator [Methylobacterium sp. NEAU 140]MDP4025369.1 GlxA family transcriptional regulator [Methylobacterium sp. NEAU 140]
MQPDRQPAPDTPPRVRLRVGFVLARRFTLCAFANFVDVLRLAADDGDRSRPILCTWSILSDTMEPVRSSCGVAVQPDTRLDRAPPLDYVVVVGGLIDDISHLGPDLVRFLRRSAEAGTALVGVCTGAFILHRAGLMDGYRCCVSWFHHADFLERFDGLVPVSDRIFVVDRDRLTCSGGASSAHLAAHLVEKHVGIAPARKSLQIMIFDADAQADKPQPGVPLDLVPADDLIKRAVLHMRQNFETPLTIAEIARRVGVARRSLERRFDRHLGRSPSDCYMAMRLDQAELLLRSTGQTVAAIATATGFCDTSHFARTYRQRRGSAPSRVRESRVRESCARERSGARG